MKIFGVILLLISTLIPISLIAHDQNHTEVITKVKIEHEDEIKKEAKEEIKEPSKNIQTLDSKIVIGEIETVKITPPKVTMKARIDTGATTTSVDARDIVEFERDGKKWVKYTIVSGKKEFKLESPIDRTVMIKRHSEKAQERFVIKMRVTIGPKTELIDVTLADRSKYKFPVLIGRNFLKDYFIVDVSRSNILKTK
ncbi:FIG008443: hypothetical protein [hydrothermal vent metagenome]|uniref:Retropepsin-like aspartic endopeptidase domain-containing protein n=1 Tax=hydrothermal vent metagenome TaxID=652676 RepID=A0A1W1EDZ7_9ZZZZ